VLLKTEMNYLIVFDDGLSMRTKSCPQNVEGTRTNSVRNKRCLMVTSVAKLKSLHRFSWIGDFGEVLGVFC